MAAVRRYRGGRDFSADAGGDGVSMTMGHGGHRFGSGRKKGSGNKAQAVARTIAGQVLSSVDQVKLWRDLLSSADERIKLETARYLTDRAFGKARESMQHLNEWRVDAVDALRNFLNEEFKVRHQLENKELEELCQLRRRNLNNLMALQKALKSQQPLEALKSLRLE